MLHSVDKKKIKNKYNSLKNKKKGGWEEESSCNAGDPGLTPWSGRSSGKGNANPLHYSCLENPMDRGAWWATVLTNRHSDTTEQLSHMNVMITSITLYYYFYYSYCFFN